MAWVSSAIVARWRRWPLSVPDSGGVYLVPAFAGLGAPHWDPYARGTIVGITRGTTRGHIARAAVESIAFQVADLLGAMRDDAGIDLAELRVDGGAAANNQLLQFQADLLGAPVVRPTVTETTALGAAYLAGLAVGFWESTDALARHWRVDRRFEPEMPAAAAAARRAEWHEALKPIEGLDPGESIRMRRADMLVRLEERREPWDMVVIGGGATGAGIAVDAASRGYDVLLLEQHDFGKGTSSRSTKLVHGGVRYLEQGNIALVMEALKERGLLRQNAPHLVSNLAFVVPNYDWWEAPFYGLGLKLYNVLAGKYGFGASEILSREETLAAAADDQDRWAARRGRLLRRPVRRRAAPDQPARNRRRAGGDGGQLFRRRGDDQGTRRLRRRRSSRPIRRPRASGRFRRAWSSMRPAHSPTRCAGSPSPTRRS